MALLNLLEWCFEDAWICKLVLVCLKDSTCNYVLQVFKVSSAENMKDLYCLYTQPTVHSTQYTIHSTKYKVQSTQPTVQTHIQLKQSNRLYGCIKNYLFLLINLICGHQGLL